MKSVCVYCGSGTGADPSLAEDTRALARALAEGNYGLVYGGGDIGLMGILAREMMALGGEVTGVIPEHIHRHVPEGNLTRLHVVKDMHARKAMMVSLSEGFIALPGGIGTLEELFEVFTWSQLGYHSRPVAVLNLRGFYDGLLTFLDGLVDRGFLKKTHRDILIVDDRPGRLLSRMEDYIPREVSKW